MLIHIFQNNYYIGNDESIIKNAIRSEDITIPEGKVIQVVNGEITFIDAEVSDIGY
jgi:hypothetical protein